MSFSIFNNFVDSSIPLVDLKHSYNAVNGTPIDIKGSQSVITTIKLRSLPNFTATVTFLVFNNNSTH